jgi:FkbH-like protein
VKEAKNMIDIKLIIWDLDETFWFGTLSEEGVVVNEDNIELIIELSERGIVNSISSKNNYDEVKDKLTSLGVWDYFVFPKIGWYSKGNAIKDTISTMGLRAENVLFIDDNHLNLKEVSSLLPFINVLDVKDLGLLNENYNLQGKDDRELTRLKQYQLLESKAISRVDFDTDLDFLHSCNIKVIIKIASEREIDRVHELILRTNQLNFTKVRLDIGEVGALLNSTSVSNYVVYVHDNYGDYGLVGFVSLNKNENKLCHFCFSCRTINLGVEQFVYNYFNSPSIDLNGETAIQLKSDSELSWITLTDELTPEEGVVRKGKGLPNILFKGGCDLSQMTFYLKGNITEETNFVTEDNLAIHSEHTSILLNQVTYSEHFPYLPLEAFDSVIFNEGFDYIIYSVLMDYSQDLYTNSAGDFIPFMGYSKKRDTNVLSENHANQIKSFYVEYKNSGPITPEKFKSNLSDILHKIDNKTRLILVNGSEVAPLMNHEVGSVERHKIMNEVVDEFYRENSARVSLVDVRKYIFSSDDLTDNIRHYKRHVHKGIADEISTVLKIDKKKGWSTFLEYRYRVIKRLKKYWSKLNALI